MRISETYRSIFVCYTCNKTMTCGPVVRGWVGIWLSSEGILFESRYTILGQDFMPTLTRVSVGKTCTLNATWHLNSTINYYQTGITWRNGFSWLRGSWYTPWRLIIKVMMTSSNGTIFRVTGPLCGEFTGPGEFPAQRPVTRSFDVFFDIRLNKRLSKQSWGWWFETPSWSLWRHCNVIHIRL